jgi:hypothetical protein
LRAEDQDHTTAFHTANKRFFSLIHVPVKKRTSLRQKRGSSSGGVRRKESIMTDHPSSIVPRPSPKQAHFDILCAAAKTHLGLHFLRGPQPWTNSVAQRQLLCERLIEEADGICTLTLRGAQLAFTAELPPRILQGWRYKQINIKYGDDVDVFVGHRRRA